jgi:multidrug resistance efflux pump
MNKPVCVAEPQIIIRVEIAGSVHALSIENATQLRDAITGALANLKADENRQQNQQAQLDALKQKAAGALQSVEGEPSPPDA